MDIEKVREGVKLRIACDNFIREKNKRKNIMSWAITKITMVFFKKKSHSN